MSFSLADDHFWSSPPQFTAGGKLTRVCGSLNGCWYLSLFANVMLLKLNVLVTDSRFVGGDGASVLPRDGGGAGDHDGDLVFVGGNGEKYNKPFRL